MGMFDEEIPEYVSGPQRIRRAGRSLGDRIAPGITELTGFESPRQKMKGIVNSVDLSSMASIQDGYKKMQQINPAAASAWLKDVMPSFNAETHRKVATASKAPSGTPENIAKAQRRAELIQQYGSTKGNKLFMAEVQKSKEDVQAAGTQLGVGASLFKEGAKRREETRGKLSKIKSAANLAKQAIGGEAPAGELFENAITAIFDGSSVKAASEIKRIASAGGLVENVTDFVNSILTGVKTQEHYLAFLKVLDIYNKEQEASYNRQTDTLSELDKGYQLGIPRHIFEKKGTKVRKWNPDTGVIE